VFRQTEEGLAGLLLAGKGGDKKKAGCRMLSSMFAGNLETESTQEL